MAWDIVGEIRKKTREEWVESGKEWVTNRRIWVQENPERAALVSLVFGIVLVLFFRLVVWVVFGCAVVAAVVWFIALPKDAAYAAGAGSGGVSANGGQPSLPDEDKPAAGH